MSQGREMFALEWVKGEIFGTLEEARQALEAFAEFGRDETRMRTCLTSLHQVHGTLVMLELPGVALLADHLERLAQGLLNKQFADDGLPCEALMQGILELPVRLEQIQAGVADTESGVLPLVNRIRKQLHLDEVAPPRPVQFVADEAALDRFERINGREKIKRIRAAYQGVLLALLKGEDEPHFLDTLKKVGVGLERICKDTPSEILWQSFGEFVDSLRLATRPLSAEIIKVLRRLDAAIRRFAQDGVEAILEPVPERLLLQLIDAAQVRGEPTSRLKEMRRRMEPANDGELLASGREALVAASRALNEEITGVKDQLDLLVRGDQPDADKLVILADSLRRIASTCGVLGFESSRLIVLDQLEVLERFKDLTELDREQLFGIASALVQVEENLASVTHLTGHAQRAPGVSDAERQVLIESRTGLEAIKQAIVNFVGSGFAKENLEGVARNLQGISAALRITGFVRPASLLEDCHAFLVTEISSLSSDGQPAQWERLDRFADCLSGIDYHLERLVTNVGAKADDILDVVERSLIATGYLGRGLVLATIESEVESATAASPEAEIEEAQPADDRSSVDEAGDALQELVDSGMPVIELDSLTFESPTPVSTDEVEGGVVWEMAPADAAAADELELAASETEEQTSLDSILGAEVPFGETLDVDTGTLSIVQALPTSSFSGGVDPAEVDVGGILLDNLDVESEPEFVADTISDDPTTPSIDAEALPLPVEVLAEVSMLAPDLVDESSSISQQSTELEMEFGPEPEPEPVERLVAQSPEAALEEPGSVDEIEHVEIDTTRAQIKTDTAAFEFDLTDSRFDVLESSTSSTESVDEQGDAELRAVFSEEAEEVVLTLDENLTRWQLDPDDEVAVREIRRGFHTLKGSGRMVGALQIGELAWAIENMLNRVLDGTLHSVGEIQLAARSARELMPALLLAFKQNVSAVNDKTAQLIELADVLASGGSLVSEDDGVESLQTNPEQEELSLFLVEAREYVSLLRSKTGRRRVQLDDELLMALHTFVGSANLLTPGVLARSAELLYEVGRAAHAQALRGPNVEVDMARLFQQAAEFIGASLDRLEAGIELDNSAGAEVIGLATALSQVADETPAEELLQGLAQLEAVLAARASFDAWMAGPLEPGFVDQFIASMRAIQGATFRPQIIDIAKALIKAISQLDANTRLAESAHAVLSESCERLLQVIDAIGADQFLPRVDDVVTKLGDLSEIKAAGPSGHESPDKATDATRPINAQIEAPYPVEVLPVARSDAGVSITGAEFSQVDREAEQLDVELAEVFFEEAEELLEALDASVQAFVADGRNGLPLENMLRGLHTLKGSARLTGLGIVGDRVHKLESFLSGLQFGHDEITTSIQQCVQDSFDAISTLTNRVREQYRHKSDSVGDGHVSAVQPSEPETAIGAGDLIHRHDENPAPLSTQPGSASNSEAAGPDMIRVRANLLETLVNLAGESSILRARVEQGINDFAVALDEMGITIERQREQLRRLELETDAQLVVFRAERADRKQEYFDPLEMDRYSQLQQLSRALSESASDMLDLKDTLLFKSREAETILLQQARINTELQEGLMRTRMVPFSRLLPRLRRIVRQIAQELKKEVEFHVFNAEGELDRNLLARMVPPLEHMLRNAVDHGIESAMVRRSFGKSLPGRIDLRVSREGGDIVIEIADDGVGIDIETVRAKAMERGMLKPDANLSDDEVLDFILAPGFSTAKSLTQISGRGVGLDVVNNEVKALGGSIGIYSSPGKGTRFVLRVPFTVSVNRALMVTVGDDQYAIPLNTIEGIVLVDNSELQAIFSSENKLFEYAGLAYRVRYLGRYLGRDLSNVTGRGGVPLVLVRSGELSMAVAVDGVQGSREIVVKSLGPQFAGVGGISGATILGDGRVVVILDLLALIRSQGRDALGAATRDVANHVHTRCVMVVDDSVTVRKVTTRLLERQGMDVIVAKDGVEAMSLLGERTPDIMLLDIEMPRMDGFEVARQMRHDPRIARIPIIMISSRTGTKHKEHALSLGIDRFLGKPFQENELLAAIDELGQRR